ncbi:MAG: hypothetical protein EBQ51_07340 [Verrucomicrobia bacterium]|nr:hypothetical protein [Pseudomonadota bacterium]NBS07221.1 hypothetical protein [Verrucomicrobiota bacterium]NBS79786.1 hypothetical protein [bacterium]NBS49714.1 hypothetical protein [Verrucomicrobiota bacterium]NBT24411.1 hypothetical protein [bacterium]
MNRQRFVSLGILASAVALLAHQSGFLHLDFYVFGFEVRTPMVLLAFLLGGFLAGALLKSS